MISNTFTACWPDYFDVNVDIAWTPPAPHDLLFSNGIPENERTGIRVDPGETKM